MLPQLLHIAHANIDHVLSVDRQFSIAHSNGSEHWHTTFKTADDHERWLWIAVLGMQLVIPVNIDFFPPQIHLNENWLVVCISCLLNIVRWAHGGETPPGIKSTGEGRFVLDNLYDGGWGLGLLLQKHA